MSYKRVVKKRGKTYGPYIYESYRDSKTGKVKKRYLGKLEEKKISKSFIWLVCLAGLILVLVIGCSTDILLNQGEFSQKVVEQTGSVAGNVGSFFSNSFNRLTALVVVDEVVEEEVEEEGGGGGAVVEEEVVEDVVEEETAEEVVEVLGDVVEEIVEEQNETGEVGAVDEANESSEEIIGTNETEEDVELNETEINESVSVDEILNETEVIVNETEDNLSEENIIEAGNQTIVVNESVINESVVNESVVGNETLNQTVNETVGINFSVENISTLQYKAIIHRPVKWIKKIKIGGRNLTVALPKDAENISILTGEEIGEALSELEQFEGVVNETDREEMASGVGLTGYVSLDIKESEGILTRFWNWLIGFGISGNVILEEEIEDEIVEVDNSTLVDLTEIANQTVGEEIAIEYYTTAPQADEVNISGGKKIVVHADDVLNYTDVLAYTLVPEGGRILVNDSRLKLYWRGSYEDALELGYVDEVEEKKVNKTAINETESTETEVEEDEKKEKKVKKKEKKDEEVDEDEQEEEQGEREVEEVEEESEEEIEEEEEIEDGGQEEEEEQEEVEEADEGVEEEEQEEEEIEDEVEEEQEEEEEESVEAPVTGGVVAGVGGVEEMMNESEELNVSEEADVVEELKIAIDYAVYDFDGDGYVDYVEWVVPHLSEQTYELIIEITKADHLDENRTFVSDIYEEVRARDGNWSEVIPEEHYVRVTFEKVLDKTKDITIYARAVEDCDSGNTSVIVINGVEVPCDIYQKKKRIDEIRGLMNG